MKQTIAIAATAAFVNAKLSNCSVSEYKRVLLGYTQGFQEDPTSTETDCYNQIGLYADSLDRFANSFSTITLDNWASPVYTFFDTFVEFTDGFAACKMVDFSK